MGSFVPKIQTNEWPGIAKREENCQQEAPGDAKPAPGGTDRQPRASQAPDRRYCQSRLAALSHRRAVAWIFAPCLVACAWRWDPSARRPFSLMCQVTPFSSIFAEGNLSLAFWRHEEHIWRAWRSARACGNSSIFLFVSLSLPFSILKAWALHGNGELNPFLLGLDVATKLLCKCKCFDYIYDSFINC